VQFAPAIALALTVTLQQAFDAKELAAYRLTPEVFLRFQEASRGIARATRDDPRFATEPLFTREVAVSGEAQVAAATLQARLLREPALTASLQEAGITAREYTTFALTLFAARLAHGFLDVGVLRRVPAGVASDNVAFVTAHLTDILALFRELGIEGERGRVLGSGFWVLGSGFSVLGSGFWVLGSGLVLSSVLVPRSSFRVRSSFFVLRS
jgi:hypothetical protein